MRFPGTSLLGKRVKYVLLNFSKLQVAFSLKVCVWIELTSYFVLKVFHQNLALWPLRSDPLLATSSTPTTLTTPSVLSSWIIFRISSTSEDKITQPWGMKLPKRELANPCSPEYWPLIQCTCVRTVYYKVFILAVLHRVRVSSVKKFVIVLQQRSSSDNFVKPSPPSLPSSSSVHHSESASVAAGSSSDNAAAAAAGSEKSS